MERSGILAVLGAVLLLAFAAGSAHATFPGENGPIVFDSFDGEVTEIYRVEADGSGFRQLSIPGPGVSSYQAAIDPGSTRIAYTRDEGVPPAPGVNRTQIHLMDMDGNGDIQLTSGPIGAATPSFSPDGGKVIFTLAGGGLPDSINTINVDGTGLTQIHSDTVLSHPVYSPDGSQIAFFAPGGIWLMGADGSAPHLIAPDGFGRPSWSPDGTRIAFYSFPPGSPQQPGLAGIHTIRPDGTDRVNEVPVDMPNQPRAAAYSPDGESLAYVNESIDLAGPPPMTIRIHALDSGFSEQVPLDLTTIQQIDWGVYAPLPPSCETDPALCPPPPPSPPAECGMRFLKSRFFVFRGRPAYRLVTKYYSADAGEVRVNFYRRKADGSRGSSLGTLTRHFKAEGRFRITRKVRPQVARKLRRSKTGFIAEFRILPREGFCEMAASLDLTKLERIQRQYVWFMRD